MAEAFHGSYATYSCRLEELSLLLKDEKASYMD